MGDSDGKAAAAPGDVPDLCDVCGALVPRRRLEVLRVPDSSAVTMDARFDGERLLRACCEPHLVQLAAGYQHRPFVAEELWSEQIVRAVRLLGPMDEEELYERVIALTGLDEEQLMRAAAWREDHGSHLYGPAPS
ncbi:hypothetical protein [Kitasatospora sp. NPDC094015]|uniref:hypothetical protein n=1 Tax=Kitasatospora sp. NPDC094015 TaxID=3155205 RepID=UPI0033247ADA